MRGAKLEIEFREVKDGRIAAKQQMISNVQGSEHALTSVPAAHRQCARDAGSLAADQGAYRDLNIKTTLSRIY